MFILFLSDGKDLDKVPPIPGYRGFIPHVRTSDVGLGSRFHNMAREGYDALYTQQSENEEVKGGNCTAGDTKAVKPLVDDRYFAHTLALITSLVFSLIPRL